MDNDRETRYDMSETEMIEGEMIHIKRIASERDTMTIPRIKKGYTIYGNERDGEDMAIVTELIR